MFGRQRLSSITPADVAAYLADPPAARGHGGVLKANTLTAHLSVMSLVFKYAQRRMGVAASNPVEQLEKQERPRRKDQRAHRVLSHDELARLLAAVPERYRLVFELAVETGARKGEVLGLIWHDLDLTPGAETISFREQLGDDGQRAPLKTDASARTLEVSSELAAKLRAAKLASAFSAPADFVFSGAAGRALDKRNLPNRVLKPAIVAAGLQSTPLRRAPTMHDLRHTHASRLIADGWRVADVALRLGPGNAATTLSTYAHAFDAVDDAVDRRARIEALGTRRSHLAAI